MFFDDHRKIATVMVGRKSGKGERISTPSEMMPESVVKNEEGEIDGRHVAAQDAMSAIHEKSPHKFMQAMMNFIDLHQNHNDSDADSQPSE